MYNYHMKPQKIYINDIAYCIEEMDMRLSIRWDGKSDINLDIQLLSSLDISPDLSNISIIIPYGAEGFIICEKCILGSFEKYFNGIGYKNNYSFSCFNIRISEWCFFTDSYSKVRLKVKYENRSN